MEEELKNWRWLIIMAGLVLITAVGPGAAACNYVSLKKCEVVAGVKDVNDIVLRDACFPKL